jgi:hypothetical protein
MSPICILFQIVAAINIAAVEEGSLQTATIDLTPALSRPTGEGVFGMDDFHVVPYFSLGRGGTRPYRRFPGHAGD